MGHIWRGATVAPVIPEPGLSPNELGITCCVDVEVEFRTRRPDFANFLTVQLPPRIQDGSEGEEERLASIMDNVLNEYDHQDAGLLKPLVEGDNSEDEMDEA